MKTSALSNQTARIALVVALLAGGQWSVLSDTAAMGKGSQGLAVSIATAKTGFLVGEPIGITITVRNVTNEWLACDLSYPEPPGLHVEIAKGVAASLPEHRKKMKRVSLLELAPGQTHQATYFVTRRLNLRSRGSYKLVCRLDLQVMIMDGPNSLLPGAVTQTYQQALQLNLVNASVESLSDRLRPYLESIRSYDNLIRNQAVEALLSIRTANAVPYLREVLRIPGEDLRAIEALAEIGTPEALLAIEDTLEYDEANPKDRYKDPMVVSLAMNCLKNQKAKVGRQRLRNLIKHPNPRMRLAVIEHVIDCGSEDDEDMIAPFVQDPNDQVAEKARRCLEKMAAQRSGNKTNVQAP